MIATRVAIQTKSCVRIKGARVTVEAAEAAVADKAPTAENRRSPRISPGPGR